MLPVARITLSLTNVTVVAGHISCIDLMKSCHNIVENQALNWKGYVSGKQYVIDPDGPGDIEPFKVNCYLDYNNFNGVTEIILKSPFNRPKNFQNKVPNGGYSATITYNHATPTQIDALTNISSFCWQNVKYVCKNSPFFLNTTSPATYYTTLGKGVSKSLGTADKTEFTGCACAELGTCYSGYICNCDKKNPWFIADQGAVTDKDALPLIAVNVGGQTWGESTADLALGPLRCSYKATDPPRDCSQGRWWNSRYGISYRYNGEFLISPNPNDLTLKPFLVYCDFNMLPGKAVTVIKVKEYSKIFTSKPNGDTITTNFEYLGPNQKQLSALISRSNYCYQGVKFECLRSPVFTEGSYWTIEGDSAKLKQTYWGGGWDVSSGLGFCACGAKHSCAGLDSSNGQRTRKCNCDLGDNEFRRDAGFLNKKNHLPIGDFTFGRYTKFGSVNITVTDLYCSYHPIRFNECTLGFHDCHEHADCVDETDGYTCVCKEGWQGKGAILHRDSPRANGRECIDDNECSWNPCHYNAICQNLPGSYNCTCKEGFERVGEMECRDIDECRNSSLNDCHENADCKNLPGSYQCRCKPGYRGDGRNECIQIGYCACFGDPHCISFDQRWLHFQGECEYVMSQDGCNGTDQTFKVVIDNGKKTNKRPGYYSWVENVYVYTLGYNITLKQGGLIEVNGNQVSQYHDTHILSVLKVINQIRLTTIIGLEIKWDGSDFVEINVPQDATGKTCGLCGNYNGKLHDDWTIGPACPEKEGQLTDNFDLFGRSWVTNNTGATECPIDCSETNPPNNTRCNVPQKMAEYECDSILMKKTSPFRECLDLKSEYDLEELKFSCIMDACLNEIDLKAQICSFARSLFDHCSTFENVKIDNWRIRTDACEIPDCRYGMVYKSCGPANPTTCLTANVNVTTQIDSNVCFDGCFCPDGYVQEGEKCIKPAECGCFYNNEYMATGEKFVLPNCTGTLECKGKNSTVVNSFSCQDNETCQVVGGVRQCVCQEGDIRNPQTGKCEPNICRNVTCPMPNTDCQNGTCACKEGFTGDCYACEDVDECETDTHECDVKKGQECVNDQGGYHCLCRKGFIPGGETCADIDECAFDLHDCDSHSECVNAFGGFRCECCSGYKKSAEGTCVRDHSGENGPAGGKCCACQSPKCDKEGQVCGTDGRTYSSYRSLMITACKDNKETLKVNYPGPCQGSCSAVVCGKQYSTCVMDALDNPQCECPTCNNMTTIYEEDMVCATNKITYISICHMKKDACEAEFEEIVEVESTGKPCNGTGKPTTPGEWSAWSNCSEPCKQGNQSRTRDGNGLKVHTTEIKPCYQTCDDGPCRNNTCEALGSVCMADSRNITSCSCPVCNDVPEEPLCARVGTYIKTFLSQCELDSTICTAQEEDFEILEPRACEVRPRHCGRIRNYKIYKDENNCQADRHVDMGFCYGGCDDTNLCCTATGHEFKFAILTCPNGSRKNKFLSTVTKCDCIKLPEQPEQ